MSRVGKQAIDIPGGVEVSIAGRTVTIKGKNGTLTQDIPSGIDVNQEDNRIVVTRKSNVKHVRACHGLVRALLQNHVIGVVDGYRKQLEIVGVSYQASATAEQITLKVGYANDIVVKIPDGVKVELPNPTSIIVTGPDKQKVGQFAAEVRASRKPEPYKGKGVRYRGEHIQRKQGKSFVGSD